MDTLANAWPKRSPTFELPPNIEFMQVALDGQSTVMALGERKTITTPMGSALHEFWYSSQHEMLHLVNGRIHRALGFTVEWRAQEATPPTWPDVQQSRHEMPWSRVVDIMPGYRYGQVDHLWIRPSNPPSSTPTEVPQGAVWLQEAVLSQTAEGRRWEYEQRFALLDGRVVYSEQCLSPQICLSLRVIPKERRP